MLVHHIRHLDLSSLASKIYKEQVMNIWPGLAKHLSVMLNIENVNATELPKKICYKIFKEACSIYEDKKLRYETQEIQKMRKI